MPATRATFDKPGAFSFYCKHHGSVEDGGKTHHGMWGKIEVKEGDTTTTSAPPPSSPPPTEPPPPAKPEPAPPPSTGPAHPPAPPPTSPPATSHGSTGPNGSNGSSGNGQTAAGSGRPYVGPPPTAPPPSTPPARVAASEPPDPEPKAKPADRGRESETTLPPEATAIPPDELVTPPSPQFAPPTTAPLAETPGDVPHGDTIAVLKNEPGGHRRKLVLFGTLFGVGAFALGVGGWKYANRPSKYWPA